MGLSFVELTSCAAGWKARQGHQWLAAAALLWDSTLFSKHWHSRATSDLLPQCHNWSSDLSRYSWAFFRCRISSKIQGLRASMGTFPAEHSVSWWFSLQFSAYFETLLHLKIFQLIFKGDRALMSSITSPIRLHFQFGLIKFSDFGGGNTAQSSAVKCVDWWWQLLIHVRCSSQLKRKFSQATILLKFIMQVYSKLMDS